MSINNKALFILFISCIIIFSSLPVLASDSIKPAFDSEISNILENQSSVFVTIMLKDNSNIIYEAQMSGEEKFNLLQRKKEHFNQDQEKILSTLPKNSFEISNKFSTINGFMGNITKEGFQKLKNDPNILNIRLRRQGSLLLDETNSLIGAEEAWSKNINGVNIGGQGQTVCVIDTGVDYTHPELGGCSMGEFLNGNCEKVIGGYNYCLDPSCILGNNNPMDYNGHGTHIAGIVAANGGLNGVAPEAKIVALKIAATSIPDEPSMVLAVDWCIDNKTKFNISVITISSGFGWITEGSNCYPDEALSQAITEANNQGIFVSVASGNAGRSDAITYPACVAGAVSVGATYDNNFGREPDTGDYNDLFWTFENPNIADCYDENAERDSIACFTNRNAKLDLLAPGYSINSINSNWEGPCLSPVSTMGCNFIEGSGTSMAAPHVAGSVALINQYLNLTERLATPNEIETALNETGKVIHDDGPGGSGFSFSRIDVYKAIFSYFNTLEIGESVDGYVGHEESWTNNITVGNNIPNLKITLDWTTDDNLHLILEDENYDIVTQTTNPRFDEDLIYQNPTPGTYRIRVYGAGVFDRSEFTINTGIEPSSGVEDPGGIDFTSANLNFITTCSEGEGLTFVVKGETGGDTIINITNQSELAIKDFKTGLVIPNHNQWITMDLKYENGEFVGDVGRIDETFRQTSAAATLLDADVKLKFDEFGQAREQLQNEMLQNWSDLVHSSPYWSELNAMGYNKFPRYQQRAFIHPDSFEVNGTGCEIFITNTTMNVTFAIDWASIDTGGLSQAITNDLNSRLETWENTYYERQYNEIVPQHLDLINNNSNYSDLRRTYASIALAQWYKQLDRSTIPMGDIIDSNNITGLEADPLFNKTYWDEQACQSLYQSEGLCGYNGEICTWSYYGGVTFGAIEEEVIGDLSEDISNIINKSLVSSYSNNSDSSTYYFGGQMNINMADLIPKHIWFNSTTAELGDTVNISIIIKNDGEQSADNFPVKIYDKFTYLNDYTVWNLISQENITNISSGVLHLIQITWNVDELGSHEIHIEVDTNNSIEEANELNNEMSATIEIVTPYPTAIITSPSDGEAFGDNETIQFDGYGSDLKDGNVATLLWESNIDGIIGTTESFSVGDLTIGTHIINLTVTDTDGNENTVEIGMGVLQAEAPLAIIISPENNQNFSESETIYFSGTGNDWEDGTLTGSSLIWTSDIDGQIGIGTSFALSILSIENHTITLNVTDSSNMSDTEQITIVVEEGKPTASIISPANNSYSTYTQYILLNGSATDPQEGSLSESLLSWKSNIDGYLGSGIINISSLTEGVHTITLTAIDSFGLIDTEEIIVTVEPSTPTASIILPRNGQSFIHGNLISFKGIGYDALDGDLIDSSLVWMSSINEIIGYGTEITNSSLDIGNHTINLTAINTRNKNVTTEVDIEIESDTPNIFIISPEDRNISDNETSIEFKGIVTDLEDVELTGSDLNWYSSLDGFLDNGNFSVTLSTGRHIITLNATDSDGKFNSSSIMVDIVGPDEFGQNRLSDSSIEKTFTFEGNENKSFWITLPKNSTIIEAKLNLKGSSVLIANEGDYTGDSFGVSGGGQLRGVANDGTYFYLTNEVTQKVYKYYMNGTNTYTNWSTTGANTRPVGIYTNGANIWITDPTTGCSNPPTGRCKIYKYQMDGTYVTVLTVPDASNPYGITISGTYFYVVNPSANPTARVYKLNIADASYVSDWFVGDNTYKYGFGVATNNTYMWTNGQSDFENAIRVFKYEMDGTNTLTNWSAPRGNYLGGSTYDENYIWYAAYNNVVYKYYANDFYQYPTNPYLDVADSGYKIFDQLGEFNTSNTTDDFSLNITNYLSSCTQDENGNCDVPLLLHSDIEGEIEVSDIFIRYFYIDKIAPNINDITLTPNLAEPSESISISVNATDNINVSEVNATLFGTLTYNETSKFYEGSVNAPSVPGTYEINVIAEDATGLITEQSVDLIVVATSPDLQVSSIVYSIGDLFINENVSINATINNYGSVTGNFKVTLLINGTPQQNNTISLSENSNTTTEFVWNATYGYQIINVTADIDNDIDPEQNETNNDLVTTIIILDNTAPIIYKINITPETVFVDDSIRVETNVTDNNGINYITTSINGTPDNLTYNSTTGWYDGYLIADEIGTRTIYITAYDSDGLSSGSSTEIEVYGTDADLEIKPSDIVYDQLIESSNTTFNITVHNNGKTDANSFLVNFLVDGIIQNNNTISVSQESETETQFNWTAEYGAHNISAVADVNENVDETDESNNDATKGLFVFDTVPPVISDVYYVPAVIHEDDLINISAIVSDNIEIDRVIVEINDTSDDMTNISGIFKGSLTALVEGNYMMIVTAYDWNNLTTRRYIPITVYSASAELIIDDVYFSAETPTDQELVSVIVDITNLGASSADDFTVNLKVNGSEKSTDVISVEGGETEQAYLNYTAEYGNITILIKADSTLVIEEINEDNNEYEINVTVVDITGPPAPNPSANPSDWVTDNTHGISWDNVSDANGINRYEYQIDYGDWTSVGTDLNFTTPTQETGIHIVYVRAVDEPGNIGSLGSVSIYIDDKNPNTPVAREWHCGNNWTSHNSPYYTWTNPGDEGSGVTNYTIDINGTVSKTNETYNETNLTTGVYEFKVKAEDILGQESDWSNTVTVYIDITIPDSPNVNSSTHSDQNATYNNNQPVFDLTEPIDDSGIAGYYYLIDDNDTTVPNEMAMWSSNNTVNVTGMFNGIQSNESENTTGLPDGTWWFHTVSMDNVGNVGNNTTHYKFNIYTNYPCYYSNNTRVNITGGIVVQNDEELICSDGSAEVIGDIENWGNLTFSNFDLTFNLTSDGQYEIRAYSGSILIIGNQTNITSNDTSSELRFVAETGSIFEMRDSYLSECGWQVTTDNSGLTIYSDNAIIINNTISNGYSDLNIVGDNVLVENNTITDGWRGMFFHQNAQYTRFINNTVTTSNVGRCVYSDYSQGTIIENNTLQYCTDGITLWYKSSPIPPAGFTNNIIIRNNEIKHMTQDGIYAYAVKNWTTDGNTIENITDSGIEIGTGSGDFSRDNITNTAYGIKLDQLTRSVSLSNTYILNSSISDIYLGSGSNTIARNITFNDTNATFDAISISIKNVLNPPIKEGNVSSYLNITNNSADALTYLNLSYDESLVTNENNLELYRYNSTDWLEISGEVVDIVNNYVYANITSFGIIGIFEQSKEEYEFVIGNTSQFVDGMLNQTYPSEDALRLGTVNELFGVNTTYPSDTLVTANWSSYAGKNNMTWINDGRLYGTYNRNNAYDSYVYNLSQTYTEDDDWGFQMSINCSSQPRFSFARFGVYNSTINYDVSPSTTTTPSDIAGVTMYSGTVSGCYLNYIYLGDSATAIKINQSITLLTPGVVYTLRCNYTASYTTGVPRFTCDLYNSVGALSWSQYIELTNIQVFDIDQVGTSNADLTTHPSAYYYMDNVIFNGQSDDGVPLTGNWQSEVQTMTAGYKLTNMTINLTANSYEYLDKVEWLDSTDVVLASNETDVTSSGLFTYVDTVTSDLDAVNEDFKIKLYLVGNGTGTPTINEIRYFIE